MKSRILVLALLLTAVALAPEPPAWASYLCPRTTALTSPRIA